MCTYNLSVNVDEEVLDIVRPEMGGDTAVETWLNREIAKALWSYADEVRKADAKRARSEALMDKMTAVESGGGIMQLRGVLGKMPEAFSWEDFKESAYTEKYGI